MKNEHLKQKLDRLQNCTLTTLDRPARFGTIYGSSG